MEVVRGDKGEWHFRTELPYEHIRDLAEGGAILPPLGTVQRANSRSTSQVGNNFSVLVSNILTESKYNKNL